MDDIMSSAPASSPRTPKRCLTWKARAGNPHRVVGKNRSEDRNEGIRPFLVTNPFHYFVFFLHCARARLKVPV